MKTITMSMLCALLPIWLAAQDMTYSVSPVQPFGSLNPAAPKETADFAPLIGICDCKSLSRNPDGTWQDTVALTWQFKYILNGMAVQDETWRAGGFYATSIRHYHPDSSQWVVSYYSDPGVTVSPGIWLGGKAGDDIVLKRDQQAPNGMQGSATLRFHNISEDGFDWSGIWIKDDETVQYPFWLIFCKKRKTRG